MTDWPLNEEIPTENGGSAMLFAYEDGCYYGRVKSRTGMSFAASWRSDGSGHTGQNLKPPKRKAWLVWYPEPCRPAVATFATEAYAEQHARELNGTVQCVEEPD